MCMKTRAPSATLKQKKKKLNILNISRTLLNTLLLNVRLRGPLQKKVIQWFNEANCCQISPATEELLFGIIPTSKETKLINKFNCTTLSMRHYIYSNKINSKGIYLQEFVNKLSLKYNLENIN